MFDQLAVSGVSATPVKSAGTRSDPFSREQVVVPEPQKYGGSDIDSDHGR